MGANLSVGGVVVTFDCYQRRVLAGNRSVRFRCRFS
jgi:hypothetical protein